MKYLTGILSFLLVCGTPDLTAFANATTAGQTTKAPKLVVLMVVDQMRADYLDRYGSNLTQGLRRLIKEGARFTNGVGARGAGGGPRQSLPAAATRSG